MRAKSKIMIMLAIAAALAVAASPFFSVATSDGEDGAFVENGVRYSKINGTDVGVVYSPEKYSGDVTVPAKVTNNGNTYNVVRVYNTAFSSCPELISVTLPDSVRELGTGVFSFSKKLESVVLPDGIDKIPDYSFHNCLSLKTVKFSADLKEVGVLAFSGCSSMTEFVLPESVNVVGESAFSSCSGLERITLPSGLETLTVNCLNGTGLKEIALPAGLKKMESSALYNANGLSSIVIPDGVTMDHWIICFAKNLKQIDIGKNVTMDDETFLDMHFYDKNGKELEQHAMSGMKFGKVGSKWIQDAPPANDNLSQGTGAGSDVPLWATIAVIAATAFVCIGATYALTSLRLRKKE